MKKRKAKDGKGKTSPGSKDKKYLVSYKHSKGSHSTLEEVLLTSFAKKLMSWGIFSFCLHFIRYMLEFSACARPKSVVIKRTSRSFSTSNAPVLSC